MNYSENESVCSVESNVVGPEDSGQAPVPARLSPHDRVTEILQNVAAAPEGEFPFSGRPATEFGSPERAVGAYNAAGISAILTPEKGPRVKGWPTWRDRTVTEEEQRELAEKYKRWDGRLGVTLILGSCARFVTLDFDQPGAHEKWLARLSDETRDFVLNEVPTVRSPKGHIGHLHLPLAHDALGAEGWLEHLIESPSFQRVPARHIVRDSDGQEDASVAIELRLPGRDAVMAPGSAYGVHDKHPERTWEYTGSNGKRIEELASLKTVTESAFKEMLAAASALNDPRVEEVLRTKNARKAAQHCSAKSLDDLPRDVKISIEQSLKEPDGAPDADLPGSDFNARATWNDVLGPAGWEELGNDLWRRPGGTGVTASTKFGPLYVYSTNAWPLEACGGGNPAYSKFRAYTVLYHDGDYGAAAKALREAGYGKQFSKNGKATIAASTLDHKTALQQQRPPLTDIGNAERLVLQHGENLRYVESWGWLRWDGRRWLHDESRGIELLAKETVRGILAEAADPALSIDQRDALINHARKSESDPAIRAMLNRAIPELPGSVASFDTDPWLLNVENGTIDLKTGILREHRREDMITKLAPVVFDPEARSEDLEKFLNAATGGDLEYRAAIERFSGYGITGITNEDKFALLTGPGGAGKTTLRIVLPSP